MSLLLEIEVGCWFLLLADSCGRFSVLSVSGEYLPMGFMDMISSIPHSSLAGTSNKITTTTAIAIAHHPQRMYVPPPLLSTSLRTPSFVFSINEKRRLSCYEEQAVHDDFFERRGGEHRALCLEGSCIIRGCVLLFSTTSCVRRLWISYTLVSLVTTTPSACLQPA